MNRLLKQSGRSVGLWPLGLRSPGLGLEQAWDGWASTGPGTVSAMSHEDAGLDQPRIDQASNRR